MIFKNKPLGETVSYQPVLKFIRQFVKDAEVKPPAESTKVKEWLECRDLAKFFQATGNDWVLLHLSTDDFFLNSFSVDSNHINIYRSHDTLDLNFPIQSGTASYGYGWSGESKQYFYEKNYLEGLEDSKMWPFFFLRDFHGYPKGKEHYYEILQEYLHFSDLHWVNEKLAYCTLNEVGDVEEKVLVIDEEDFSAILTERSCLEPYLLYRGEFVARFLELKRAMPKADWLSGSREDEKRLSTEDRNSWIRLGPHFPKDVNKACDLVRAVDLVQPIRTIEDWEQPQKSYEIFTIQDWKNGRVIDSSCDPSVLDSYFEDTGKPFQTSPAFFHPDVLLKYKREPEKYELRHRHIYCRGSWSLKTFDINEEGQVHTYICYLGDLPHREQLHWKQYNEAPKGAISERAYKTDFMAEWVKTEEPLQKLAAHFKNFPDLEAKGEKVTIWKPKEDLDTLLSRIHKVSSGKLTEYKDFLQNLCILVVDGFQESSIKELVKEHTNFKDEMKSLGCLRLLLKQLGLEDKDASAIVKPLKNLQEKRSKFCAHGGSTPTFDLVGDATKTANEIEVAINALIALIKASTVEKT